MSRSPADHLPVPLSTPTPARARADATPARLQSLADRRLLRTRRPVRPLDATHVEIDGRCYVNFASNNYLGLTHHPRVLAAACASLEREGIGGGASPLVTGHTTAHASAERALAAWKGTEAALLLPSGFQANLAAVQTLAALYGGAASTTPETPIPRTPSLRFLLDKLCHASLIDAVGATNLPFRVFPHNHLGKLGRLLAESDPNQTQVVATESIFSMDGDAADLAGLGALRAKYPFLLLLDEAHASGVYGRHGSGLANELGLSALPDVTVVTLSKALGCAGGAICGSRMMCDAIVNLGRAYIYSTAVAPPLAAAAEAALAVLCDEPQHQQRVRALAGRVRAALGDCGLAIPPGDSPIIPILLGTEDAALGAAERLQSHGLYTIAIRPPTVPKNTSRLRITLSARHTDEEVESLVQGLIPVARDS